MKRAFIFSLIVLCLGVFARGASAASLTVVATTPSLAAVAKEVGGPDASVSSLSLPTQDPHFVDARPHLALELARADLLLVVGLGLESGWLPPLQVGSRNGNLQTGGKGYLDCSQFASLREVPKGPVDRSMGDIHPGGSPHYLYDPRMARTVATGIAERMAQLDPPHAAGYRDRAKHFGDQVQAGIQGWDKAIAKIRGQKIVDFHQSFAYLADWLGVTVVDHLEPKPGIAPNPRHVADVVTRGKEARVRILLQEQFYPDNLSKLAAEKLGARIVQISSGPEVKGGQSYLAHIGDIVKALASAS
jgi:zinc/manganese transport system substrate-binding protein